jgi:hypothetical protein
MATLNGVIWEAAAPAAGAGRPNEGAMPSAPGGRTKDEFKDTDGAVESAGDVGVSGRAAGVPSRAGVTESRRCASP